MKETPNAMDHLSDELLSERLDGQLAPSAQARVDAHLADCAACAARYAGLQGVQRALGALRHVEAVPDFRLTAQGLPRTPRRPLAPVAPAPNVRPMYVRVAARLVSAAMLLAGIALIALALGTSLTHTAMYNAAASQAAPNRGTVGAQPCGQHCPGVSTPVRPTSGAGNPTATPSPASTATPVPDGTPSQTPVGDTSLPLPPLEFGLGVVLITGGCVTLARLGRR